MRRVWCGHEKGLQKSLNDSNRLFSYRLNAARCVCKFFFHYLFIFQRSFLRRLTTMCFYIYSDASYILDYPTFLNFLTHLNALTKRPRNHIHIAWSTQDLCRSLMKSKQKEGGVVGSKRRRPWRMEIIKEASMTLYFSTRHKHQQKAHIIYGCFLL